MREVDSRYKNGRRNMREAVATGKRGDSRYKNSLRKREQERRGYKEKRIVDIRGDFRRR